MKSTRVALAALAGVTALLVAAPRVTLGATGGVEALPLFSISKTQNRNYVEFVLRVDQSCAPSGPAPVSEYWRMVERGPDAVEPLLFHEQPAYGLAWQSAVAETGDRYQVHIRLRAAPAVPLLVESRRARDGACEAWASTTVGGVEARLRDIHAVLRWPFGVARLLLSGWALDDGRPVQEVRFP